MLDVSHLLAPEIGADEYLVPCSTLVYHFGTRVHDPMRLVY